MKTAARYKEWIALTKRERRFLEEGSEKKESALNQLLEDKIPDKLQDTLDAAFAKAFELVFEKGTGVIEKTYNREKVTQKFKVSKFTADLNENKKSLRAFAGSARSSGTKNMLISGVEGIGLGVLGIGIPDIPLFTAVMLKSIYEIALNFGYEYESEEEKFFVLKTIEASLSYGNELLSANKAVDDYIASGKLPEGYSRKQQIIKTSAVLSKELLYMKFLQGLPIVGAVGGAYDAVYLNKVLKYAQFKYRRRLLLDRGKEEIKKL